ncbi:MAG: hybrid sensor histidine kinase/response regulator [Lysobacteraceae bacterium]|nr:MAG: hybrid sensor histidine kinase/response regulator [Xanthomonadaceae bacterium]
MSSPNANTDAAAALEGFRQQLDTLVLLLQAANELPEMAEPGLLYEMIDTLLAGSHPAGLPGIGELLRNWSAGLRDLERKSGMLSQEDLTLMTVWFMGLQGHANRQLDEEGRAMLAQMPEGIRWLPRLSPGFVRAILQRLQSTPVAEPAAAVSSEQSLATESTPALAVPPGGSDDLVREGISAGERSSDASAFGGAPIFADQNQAKPDAFSFEAETASTEAVFAAGANPIAAQDSFASAEHDAVAAPAFLIADVEPAPAVFSDGLDSHSLGSDGHRVDDQSSADHDNSAAAQTPFIDAGIDQAALLYQPSHPIENTATGAIDDSDGTQAAGIPARFETSAIDTAVPASGTIWIGQDELDLTRQAIVEQLLPLTQSWAETSDEDLGGALIEELSYQWQLLVNVMELIGAPVLARGMDTVRQALERRDAAAPPEMIATWCSALLAAVEQPEAQSAELLAMISQELPDFDAGWSQAIIDEFSRIEIGHDPALIAQRKTIAEFDDVSLKVADDVLPSVLEGMFRELPGNAVRFGEAVRSLVDTGSPEPIDEARRIAHTLKGDANTVGIRGLANLTHALEDILLILARQPERLTPACADLLVSASDSVEEISDHLLGRGPAPDNLLDIYQQVLDTANALADGADTPTASAALPRTQQSSEETGAVAAADIAEATAGARSLNVPSRLLDELQRLAGESLVTARQIDQQLEGLSGLHREQRQGVRNTHELMGRLDDLVALRGAALQSTAQKTGAELDPLEIDQYNELHVISRQLLEAHADSGEFMRRIERTMNALTELRNEQEQLNRDLQRVVLRTRTVPFGQVSARLQRIVRQTAKQLFKSVQLDLIGEEIPLDAELLERVVEPLAHLLRNAIDHGIEAPEQRRANGKPETGRITVRVGLQGDSALLEIEDDGRGLDPDAIRERAVRAGLLQEDQPVDDRLLARLILLPGFSTRSSTSEISGRGIGMDVVNQRIAALRGALTIHSEAGRGMRVVLRLPVTQTLANVIIARGQRQVSAVVAASVERVVSFAAGECRYEGGKLMVTIGDETVPGVPVEAFYAEHADIGPWLGHGGVGLYARDADGLPHVVLVRSIDEVRSVVVKPISEYLPPIPAVRGITQLGDGGLAPVIDLDVLLQSAHEAMFASSNLLQSEAITTTRVVVADDSLSVRRALEQLMQDAGYEVATARDGFEALAAIQEKPTHALLVDLEMPRMNGLEVTRNLRIHDETREMPVVMITSRATDKHRAMAEQAGVTQLLGKPFSEDALVTLVQDLIAARHMD